MGKSYRGSMCPHCGGHICVGGRKYHRCPPKKVDPEEIRGSNPDGTFTEEEVEKYEWEDTERGSGPNGEWTDKDEEGLEDHEIRKRQRIAEQNEY